MKSVKDWIDGFPEPFRTQALNNATGNLDVKVETGIAALYRLFAWNKSPEGWSYWNNFKNTLK